MHEPHLRRSHAERALNMNRFPRQIGDTGNDSPFIAFPTLTGPVTVTLARPATASTTLPVPVPILPTISPPIVSPPSATSSSSTTSPTVTAPTIVPTRPASSPTNQPANKAANSGSQTSGLSSGAIAGIIIAILIALFGIGIFIARRRFVRSRQAKRATWGGAIFPSTSDPMLERSSPPRIVPFTQQAPSPISLSPPPMSYNNPPPMTPSMAGAGNQLTTAEAPSAVVRCTFIPNLPDELSITNGEIVRILGEYDDGWSLCINNRGEQGMVPLECLVKNTAPAITAAAVAQSADWKNAQRASSLAGPSGSRY